MSTCSADPPEGSYLASRYRDSRRGLETRRLYHEDGRVDAFDGREWWTVCHFSPDQVGRAKDAIRESGLLTASDMTAEGFHDTATLTYSWQLDGQHGSVTNRAYPARDHPAFVALEERLNALEDEAGAP
jgi:hypothetical protein